MKKLRIYFWWNKYYVNLSDAELGRLFTAMLRYAATGEEINLIGNELSAFDEIKKEIDLQRGYSGYAKGVNHWNWKGGITPKNQVGRSSPQYVKWRNAVFIRDNYTCQVCKQHGGKLNAHHIKSWADNVNARYDVSNGITLCKECHRSIHRRK